MKFSMKYLVLSGALIMTFLLYAKHVSAQQENVSFQVFYDELSPYGEWVDYQNYGYVWIPDVDQDFVPYSTAGYWVLTDYGWTWMSDYEWGWAPFHYGRWDFDHYYGWFWVPDNEWGPSWVNWRRADGYYGWSPMEPGISINLSFGRQYNRNNDHWMFVRDVDFERHDLNRYSVDRSNNVSIIRNSTVINTTYIDNSRHTTYITGPAREDVQSVTGRRINPVTIRENSQPGQVMSNGQLQIYRPRIEKNNGNQLKSAPARISELKDVRRPSERKETIQPGSSDSRNNHRVQPIQTRSVTNGNENIRQQPAEGKPQNNRVNLQPAQQQQQANPSYNVRQQPGKVRPQNSNAKPQNRDTKEKPGDSGSEKDKR